MSNQTFFNLFCTTEAKVDFFVEGEALKAFLSACAEMAKDSEGPVKAVTLGENPEVAGWGENLAFRSTIYADERAMAVLRWEPSGAWRFTLVKLLAECGCKDAQELLPRLAAASERVGELARQLYAQEI